MIKKRSAFLFLGIVKFRYMQFKMNRILPVFILVPLLWILCSNVSQPGVYNSGGMAFTMLFPEDSLAYKKIQMREERIYIQLYKGYAVVKGVYQMVNTSSDKLSFKMGYPIKGIYHGGAVESNEVSLDSIYKFKVKSNGNELPILTHQFDDTNEVMTFANQNWLTWQMDFLPQQENVITVYFIVNTNNGQVARGYSKDYLNVFTYLLESGKVWKQPIEKATFTIQLRDGLSYKAIRGLSEHFQFEKASNAPILLGGLTAFSPLPKDNLIITYGHQIENFDFEKVLEKETILFEAIDDFSNQKLPSTFEKIQPQSPYEVSFDIWSTFPFIIVFLGIMAPIVLIVVVVFYIFKQIYNRRKSK